MKAFTLAALLAAAPVVAHAQVIDQSQPTVGAVVVGNIGYWNGQSFTPTFDSSVGAGFYIGGPYFAPNGTLTVELSDEAPPTYGTSDIPNTATMLASGSAPVDFVFAGWVDVFWNAVALTPGQTYFLTFNAGTNAINGNYNVYAGGQAYGGTGATPNADTGPYFTNGDVDFTFREYAASPAVGVTTTPEPSTLLLLGSGIAGLVPVIRRRRK